MPRYAALKIAATCAFVVSATELRGQDQKIPVMHAAALFVKGRLPWGRPVLLALEGAAADSVEADNVARALGATRGNAATAISCVADYSGKRPERKCSVVNNAVVVEVLSPFVLGNKAQTTIIYSHESSRRRVYSISYELELAKDANGIWHVAKVLAIGAT